MLEVLLKRLADEPASVELAEWWKSVVALLDSTEKLVTWNIFCSDHESIASRILKEYSWELFDHICYLFLSCTSSREMVIETQTCIKTLSKHIRPKELYIISVEKLLGCIDMQLWHVLLYALQLAMVDTSNINTFNSGTLQYAYRIELAVHLTSHCRVCRCSKERTPVMLSSHTKQRVQ